MIRRMAIATFATLTLAACGGGASVPEAVYVDPVRAAPTVSAASTWVEGLQSPWSILPNADTALVSERDSGRIVRVDADGSVSTVTTIDGVVHEGESGLLGLAVPPSGGELYAYYTSDTDNRVVRMPWDGQTLGAPVDVVTGIDKNTFHDGGGLAFGPDGMLYIATGDAGAPELSQDMASLNGKILRVTPNGGIPADNPFPDSPIYSLGHRNVQGLAFDGSGQLWATEFGTSEADELNRIVAGGNYGWPMHEGTAGAEDFIDPAAQWSPTSLASPSGLAILDDVAYVASLRGQVVWQVPLVGDAAAEPIALNLGDLGRLRAITVDGPGRLLLATSNTDGRGDVRNGDDRIIVLEVE